MITNTANNSPTTCGYDKSIKLVPEVNGRVRLSLDLARLTKVVIRLVHRGPKLNSISLRLTGMKNLTLSNASLGYHNFKLEEKSSYLASLPCPFGMYQYIRPPFGAEPVGDMFQRKIDEMFSNLQNVHGIVNDILITGFYK